MIISKKRFNELAEGYSRALAKNARLENEKEITDHNNHVLLKKNKELTKKLDAITTLVTGNTYNNEQVIFAKLKELVRPGKLN